MPPALAQDPAAREGRDEKKGSTRLPFLLLQDARLLAGVDLDQRLVRLRWQGLALAGLAHGRRHLGGCFLGCTQLFRIGRGQGQAGRTQHVAEVGDAGRGRRCRCRRGRLHCHGSRRWRCHRRRSRSRSSCDDRHRRHFFRFRLHFHRDGDGALGHFQHGCWRWCRRRLDGLGGRWCGDAVGQRGRHGSSFHWSGCRCRSRRNRRLGNRRYHVLGDGFRRGFGRNCSSGSHFLIGDRREHGGSNGVVSFAFTLACLDLVALGIAVAAVAVAATAAAAAARLVATGFGFHFFTVGAGRQDGLFALVGDCSRRGGGHGRVLRRPHGFRHGQGFLDFRLGLGLGHDGTVVGALALGTGGTLATLGTLTTLGAFGTLRTLGARRWCGGRFGAFTGLTWLARWTGWAGWTGRTGFGVDRTGHFFASLGAFGTLWLAVTVAAAATWVATIALAAVYALGRGRFHRRRAGGDGGGHGHGFLAHEEVDHLVEEALGRGGHGGGDCHGRGGGGLDLLAAVDDRGGLGRGDGLDDGFLARLDVFLLALAVGHVGVGLLRQVVAGLAVFQTGIVVLDALELVVGGVEVLVGDQDHADAVAVLDLQHFAPLFIEQEGGDIDGHLHVDGGRVFLHRLFLDDAQHLQGGRFGIADVAGAGAARAGHVGTFRQGRAQALA